MTPRVALKRQLGCYVFSAPPSADPLALLPDALDAVGSGAPISLLMATRDYKSRSRKYLGEKSVRKAWDDDAGTELICLTSVARNCYDPQNHDYSQIGFRRWRMGASQENQAPLGEVGIMHATPEGISDPEAFVRATLRLFSRTASSQYGYVHCTSCVQCLQIETSILPGNPWIPQTLEHTVDRLELVDPLRTQVGEKIIGAHWGVLLAEHLVAGLGGIARVEREAPVYRVSRLDNHAAFLQLTEFPLPVIAPEMLRALPEFEAYLEPISLPIGPYFRRKIPEHIAGKIVWEGLIPPPRDYV